MGARLDIVARLDIGIERFPHDTHRPTRPDSEPHKTNTTGAASDRVRRKEGAWARGHQHHPAQCVCPVRLADPGAVADDADVRRTKQTP